MQSFTFNHLAISVRDVEESLEFYQKVLQLKEIPNTASNSLTRWLDIGEGRQLHLIPRPNFKLTTIKAVHFALSTPDFDAFIASLEALNVRYTDWRDTPDRSYVRKDGIRQVYFQDPNGNWVEVNNDVR